MPFTSGVQIGMDAIQAMPLTPSGQRSHPMTTVMSCAAEAAGAGKSCRRIADVHVVGRVIGRETVAWTMDFVLSAGTFPLGHVRTGVKAVSRRENRLLKGDLKPKNGQ